MNEALDGVVQDHHNGRLSARTRSTSQNKDRPTRWSRNSRGETRCAWLDTSVSVEPIVLSSQKPTAPTPLVSARTGKGVAARRSNKSLRVPGSIFSGVQVIPSARASQSRVGCRSTRRSSDVLLVSSSVLDANPDSLLSQSRHFCAAPASKTSPVVIESGPRTQSSTAEQPLPAPQPTPAARDNCEHANESPTRKQSESLSHTRSEQTFKEFCTTLLEKRCPSAANTGADCCVPGSPDKVCITPPKTVRRQGSAPVLLSERQPSIPEVCSNPEACSTPEKSEGLWSEVSTCCSSGEGLSRKSSLAGWDASVLEAPVPFAMGA